MKKHAFTLLLFLSVLLLIYSLFGEPIVPVAGTETSDSTVNKIGHDSNFANNQSLVNYYPASSASQAFSSHGSGSFIAVINERNVWIPVAPVQEIKDKIDSVIGNFSTAVTREFIEVDPSFLEKIEVGGIYGIPIPDAANADVHVSKIEKKDGLTNVVGHLSGYPESYYIGFSFDKEGHIYGEITTEKSNYSIKTYYGQPVIIKVAPEMEKTQRDDF